MPYLSHGVLGTASKAPGTQLSHAKQLRGKGGLGRNVYPARAQRTTFLLPFPTSSPDLSSHGEAPQVDHVGLHTFPTKHVA